MDRAILPPQSVFELFVALSIIFTILSAAIGFSSSSIRAMSVRKSKRNHFLIAMLPASPAPRYHSLKYVHAAYARRRLKFPNHPAP